MLAPNLRFLKNNAGARGWIDVMRACESDHTNLNVRVRVISDLLKLRSDATEAVESPGGE